MDNFDAVALVELPHKEVKPNIFVFFANAGECMLLFLRNKYENGDCILSCTVVHHVYLYINQL